MLPARATSNLIELLPTSITATVSGIALWDYADLAASSLDGVDPPSLDIFPEDASFSDMVSSRLVVFGFVVAFGFVGHAQETPLPLGAADLVHDARFDSFKPDSQVLNLEQAFEVEAIKQLDLEYEGEPPSDLEVLKRENELLKQRVIELERRLTEVEAKLDDL